MSDTVALWLGERLLIGSLQGAVVIALVWLVCRLVPRIPAAVQASLWWLATLKLVLVFTPVPALPVALLPADASAESISQDMPAGVPYDAELSNGTAEAVPYGSSNTRTPIDAVSWPQLLVMLWFAVVVVHAARLLYAHRLLGAIVKRSVVWHGEESRELAERLGLARPPEVWLSSEIDTPQVCGLRKPIVLVPAETMATFTTEERAMVLCHELMHLRRRDLAFGWVPACAERLFFFHPLARLAARRYVDARETACDAAAVRALGVSAAHYGRMLVRLGIGDVRPALAAGGSPFSASSLKRRLRMLERQDLPVSRRWWVALVLIAAVVIPIQLVARTPAPPAQERPSPTAVVPIAPPKEIEIHAEMERAAQQIEAAEAAYNAQAKRMQDLTGRQQMLQAMAQVEAARARLEAQRHSQESEEHERFLAIMALIKSAAAHRDVERLHNTLTLADVLKMQNSLNVKPGDLAQHYRQLAEHYERLAIEQRRLAEDIERLQREGTAKP